MKPKRKVNWLELMALGFFFSSSSFLMFFSSFFFFFFSGVVLCHFQTGEAARPLIKGNSKRGARTSAT